MCEKKKDGSISAKVYDDGHAAIGFWKLPFEGGSFSIVMSDKGGYSSVMMNQEGWEEIKTKVDNLITKYVKVSPPSSE